MWGSGFTLCSLEINMSDSESTEAYQRELATVLAHTESPMALLSRNVIVDCNAAFGELIGAPDNAIGQPLDNFIAAEYIHQLDWLMKDTSNHCDKTILQLNEEENRNILAQFWRLDESLSLFSLLADFSTERVADLDMLTQLPNRRHASMLLEMEVQQIGRGGNGFCLALGDIDRFKMINDLHGHNVGDAVLKHVADVLASDLRKGDWAARWGGEEFLLYIKNDDLATGLQPIERIKQKLNEKRFPGPPSLLVTMSFGVVSSAGQPEHLQTIVEKADMLMYESKNNGRNRITWEDKDKESSVWAAARIRQAIADGNIVPSYTPLLDWTGHTIALKVSVGLRQEEIGDEDEHEQVVRLLNSADSLRLRADVEWAMLNGLRAQLDEHQQNNEAINTPLFVSPSNATMQAHWNDVMALFKAYPFMHLGVYVHEKLSDTNTDRIIDSRLPVALIDFNHNQPIPAPIHYLHYDIRHIVFESVDANSRAVLNFLPRKIKCYCPKEGNLSPTELHAYGFSGTIAKEDKQQTLRF